MKLHEVLLRAAGKIKWWQAAELVGIASVSCVDGGSGWKSKARRACWIVDEGHRAPARAEGEDGTGSEPVSGQVLRSERHSEKLHEGQIE